MAAILKEEVNVKGVKFGDRSADVAEVFTDELGNYRPVDVDEETRLFLNCCPSKTLIEEGLVRDIVRRIQGMRKDLDLEYTEKIGIMYACDEEVKEAIHDFLDYIRDETLAASIEESTPSNSAEDAAMRAHLYEKLWNIGNKEVYLAIKPLSSAETE